LRVQRRIESGRHPDASTNPNQSQNQAVTPTRQPTQAIEGSTSQTRILTETKVPFFFFFKMGDGFSEQRTFND
jgi:hypothetical protein